MRSNASLFHVDASHPQINGSSIRRHRTNSLSTAEASARRWESVFNHIGISPALFNKAFPLGLSDLAKTKLYNIAARWRKANNGVTFEFPWQLHCFAETPNIEGVLGVQCSQLIDIKDNLNKSVLHYIGFTCNPTIIRHYPELTNLVWCDNQSLFHCAIQSASHQGEQAIESATFIIEHYPQVLSIETNFKSTFIQIAALSGSIKMLEFIDATFALNWNNSNIHGLTILHYAAKSGIPEMLEYVLKHAAEKGSVIISNPDDLHEAQRCAAWSGSTLTIELFARHFPYLPNRPDLEDYNVLFYAAKSGSSEAVRHLKSRFPDLDITHSRSGISLLHAATMSVSIPMIEYILKEFPALTNALTADGKHFVDLAVETGSASLFRHLCSEHPDLVATRWHLKAEILENEAKKHHMKPLPSDIINELLSEATIKLGQPSVAAAAASESDHLCSYSLDPVPLNFINQFALEWFKFVLLDSKVDNHFVEQLLRNKNIPAAIKQYAPYIKNALAFKEIDTKNKTLDLDLLNKLIHTARNCYKNVLVVFSGTPYFLDQLNLFARGIKSPKLTIENVGALYTLLISINNQKMTGTITPAIHRMVMDKLFETETMQAYTHQVQAATPKVGASAAGLRR